jgi:hypothetical protein
MPARSKPATPKRGAKSGGTSWFVLGAVAIASAAVAGAVLMRTGGRALSEPPKVAKAPPRDGAASQRKGQDTAAAPPTPDCADDTKSCDGWAATGECQSRQRTLLRPGPATPPGKTIAALSTFAWRVLSRRPASFSLQATLAIHNFQ